MAQRRFQHWLILLIITGLSACTLTDDPVPPAAVVTATIPALPTGTLPLPASTVPPLTPTGTPLVTFTGPYENAAALLDGVCFEFLTTLGGQTWAWTAPGDLAAFYDRADTSKACSEPVRRGTFDFAGQALIGAVRTGTGCDAAYRFSGMAQDDTAAVQIFAFQLEVQTGCSYELIEPLLVAIPQPPAGYTLDVAIIAP